MNGNPQPQTKAMPTRIYPKDLATLQDIAYFRYMTAHQIQRVHYPNAKDFRTTTRRLTNLADQYNQQTGDLKTPRYVSYVFLHDNAAPLLGRPRRVFHIAPHNLKQIEDAYKQRGIYEDYQYTYADYKPIPRPSDGWAPAHLKHELAITDYGLAHREGANDTVTRLFWEATSPIKKEISKTYNVRRPDPNAPDTLKAMRVNLNPDAIDCVQGETHNNKTILYFSLTEIDRNTENLEKKFLPKVYAFDEFIKQRDHQWLLDHYAKTFHLSADFPYLKHTSQYAVVLRIRIITIGERRRNDLIRIIAKRSRYPQVYHLATFDDLHEWSSFYTRPTWYVARDYEPIKQREGKETKYMRQRALSQWIAEQIEQNMRPVPYFYQRPTQKE